MHNLNEEAARCQFISAMRDKLMEESLPLLIKEAASMHPTRTSIVLKMILGGKLGQVRQLEASMALNQLLLGAAVDVAEQCWLDLRHKLPLREAA